MDPWQQIERIFLAASELPPTERAAFVAREAAGVPELRTAVEGMLRHSDAGGTRFQQAVEHTAVSAASTEPEPARIDRYTILRELGRGGMGAVYLAERAGAEFRQQVAIKVVKRGMDTAQIIERFRHERRILASLDHPNIARLFDGGATSDGAPYIVMEYIEGRPLVEYCRQLALPLRERLRLFEQICAAVQHAHQNLIVHRDIKPANILVTAGGVPKLLDFGISKLLLPDDAGGEPSTLTRAGVRLLTPDYASPEQVRGGAVNVASDVYSLGVVLYELLTGKRAHQFTNYTEAEYVRVICDFEVRPPSEAVEDTRLRRKLSGDLDNIVGLALRKDPTRRYVSVEQFAGDIRRYLDGLPVHARGETLFYRAGKFVTRHRIPVAASLLVLASLSAGIVGTTLQARRADAQAARAERRFQQVRKLANSFLFDFYDGMVEIPGTAMLRANVVTTALEYLDSLAREAEGETALQLELAAAYKRIGDVQGNPSRSGLGQVPAALVSYQKAAAILSPLARRESANAKVLADLGNLERTLGYMRLNTGEGLLAMEHLRKSIAAWERRNPERGQNLEADTGIAQAWGIMGQALVALGESSAAVARHAAAVDLMRSWLPRQIAETTQGTISLMLSDLAEARRDTGDLRGAAADYLEAVRIRKAVLQKSATSLNYRRRLFVLYFNLAMLFGNPLSFSLGDQAAAETYATEALRLADALAKEDQGSARSVRDRLLGNWMLGCVLLPASAARARPYLETSLKIASELYAADHDNIVNAQTEANAQEALGRALLVAGDRRRAIDLLRSSAATLERVSREAPQMIEYRFDLIRTANALGDALPAPAAAEFYRQAYRAAEPFPPGDRNVWEALSRAEVNVRWPRWNGGAPAAERTRRLEAALASWQKLAAHAPDNRSLQASLQDTRRSLTSR